MQIIDYHNTSVRYTGTVWGHPTRGTVAYAEYRCPGARATSVRNLDRLLSLSYHAFCLALVSITRLSFVQRQ